MEVLVVVNSREQYLDRKQVKKRWIIELDVKNCSSLQRREAVKDLSFPRLGEPGLIPRQLCDGSTCSLRLKMKCPTT